MVVVHANSSHLQLCHAGTVLRDALLALELVFQQMLLRFVGIVAHSVDEINMHGASIGPGDDAVPLGLCVLVYNEQRRDEQQHKQQRQCHDPE